MATITLTALSATQLQIPGADPWYANPDDPALSVMTDFRERASVTIAETATVDAALEHMKHTGVRCAFAIDDAQRRVVGLITAYDIMGERPMRHMQSVAVTRAQVLVKDLMVKLADWRVITVKQIERSTVSALAKIFAESHLTHIAVVETDEHGAQRLRGLLSAARVKRLLSR